MVVIDRSTYHTYKLPDDNAQSIESHSWFSLTGTKQNVTTYNEYGIDEHTRTKRARLFPSQDQAKILDAWIETYRLIYNLAVSHIKTYSLNGLWTKEKTINAKKLRNVVKATHKDIISKALSTKIPVHTIDNAIFDVAKSYNSSFALAKITKKPFTIRPKKQGASKVIVLEASTFGKSGKICARVFKQKIDAKSDGELYDLSQVKRDCRLTKEKNQFILHVPCNYVGLIHEDRAICIAGDPGIRTIMTLYDSQGNVHEVKDKHDRIRKLDRRLQHLIKLGKDEWEKFHTIHRINRRIKQVQSKITNLVKDMQFKSAKHFAINNDCVIIGKLSTIGVVNNDSSVLSAENKRMIYHLAHYSFRQRIKNACELYGSKFVEQNEWRTSMTCGVCGNLDRKLGSSKKYDCISCGFICGRDANAARNIMIAAGGLS